MSTRHRELQDGSEDGLVALRSLDPLQTRTCDELLAAMASTSFGGRRLGEAADLLTTMVRDPDCRVVMTLSGAMTAAKMSLVIVRMIEAGMVQCIISTGALMAHGLCEGIGMKHFKADPRISDEDAFAKGYDRIYDTLELEANLNETEVFTRQQLEKLPPGEVLSSEKICRAIGRGLSEGKYGPSILGAAYDHDVPVFVPAFTDSELGLDVALMSLKRWADDNPGRSDDTMFDAAPPPTFNPFLDLLSYAKFCNKQERLGIFTIGGGVPRNWAQQISPLYDLMRSRLGIDVELPRFRYAVRICPEPAHWGGLSGCTYSEGVSWGKFVPESEGGRFAEVHADATVAWPLLVRAVLERLGKV